jgi:hypothetical protein
MDARTIPLLHTPPKYCQYAAGPCDHSFASLPPSEAFFIYPSEPQHISATIESAIGALSEGSSSARFKSWKNLPIHGQLIFCEICKALRTSKTVVADVTTLNFNLLYEIGFCIGLGVPLIPIRDTSYIKSRRDFEELGVLDVLGYVDFTNSSELAKKLRERLPGKSLPAPSLDIRRDSPLYLIKGPLETDGELQLFATVKKSRVRFRAYDPIERRRLSLTEAQREIAGSIGVIAHLLGAHRAGATKHNALCALLCGLAMATEKVVLMVQEHEKEQPPHPIDFRDLVQQYPAASAIPALLEEPLRAVIDRLQETGDPPKSTPRGVLSRLDLGDPAAENEVPGLRKYFFRSGQFHEVRNGNARLVVGRKGAGKTAMFYGIREAVGRSKSVLCLDLKPEGHQFKKLREAVLMRLSLGDSEHTVTAFWSYILLCEMAWKILRDEARNAALDPVLRAAYDKLESVYQIHDVGREADFSQRLQRQVQRVAKRFAESKKDLLPQSTTEFIYAGDIHQLTDALAEFLSAKEQVWILIDNLDKGWPTKGSTAEDILILRALLESTRKIARELDRHGVDLRTLVFIRTDIYEHLLKELSDRGKDTAVRLDSDDPEFFRQVYRLRAETSLRQKGAFGEMWNIAFVEKVYDVPSFDFVLSRTLRRSRDMLVLIRAAIMVALNRGHARVEADDLLEAERAYSEDMLLLTGFEIADSHPQYDNILYTFQSSPAQFDYEEVVIRLMEVVHNEVEAQKAIELLIWYGFLGVSETDTLSARYCYDVNYNTQHLVQNLKKPASRLVVHPAFRVALGIVEKDPKSVV